MNERFQELWTDYLEGELDPASLSELSALLEGDDDLCRLAADLYEEHRLLGVHASPFDRDAFVEDVRAAIYADRDAFVTRVSSAVNKQDTAPKGNLPGYILAAACALLVSLGFQWFLNGGSAIESAREELGQKVAPVATLLASDQIDWESTPEVSDDARLVPQVVKLRAGTVAIRFDSGATAILSGPCELEIESRSSVRIARGEITVHAPDEAYGFRVVTPTSEIIDLGTEFVVSVDEGQTTSMQVLDGEIQAHATQGEDRVPRILGTDMAKVIESDGRLRDWENPPARKRFRESFAELRPPQSEQRLITQELFDYPSGAQPLDTLDGGHGWNGPWRARRGSETRHFERDEGRTLEIVRHQSQFQGFGPDADEGDLVRFGPGGTVRIREFREPVDLGRDATYFVSFLLRRDKHPSVTNRDGKRLSSSFRLTLRSSDDYWGDLIGVSFPDSRRPFVQLREMERFSTPARFMRSIPLLWVMKIEAQRNAPDRVFARVYESDEDIGLVEPALWTCETDSFDSDARLNLLLLTASSPHEQWFDELRVGDGWESVTRPYQVNPPADSQ